MSWSRSTLSTYSGSRRSMAEPMRCSTTCSRGRNEPAQCLDYSCVAVVPPIALVGQYLNGAFAAVGVRAVFAAAAFLAGAKLFRVIQRFQPFSDAGVRFLRRADLRGRLWHGQHRR